ncbi:MAG: CPBP family glutamic-type intramembrane protease [Gemmatales bacterium]
MHGYWQTTKHPWPCLLFVLPLLAFYEGSMIYQAMEGLQPYRAGLDSWMHTMLVRLQWHADYAPSLLIAIICVSWAVILWDRSPPENLSTLAGMFLECVVYSLAMWGLGALVTSQLAHLSISQRTMQAVSLMGSGLFEEVLFRLLGFGLLLWLLKWVIEERTALIVALLISSVGFAAAHHLGPHGEAWQLSTFVFRSMAGLIFASLFHYRGLGIAVGTHSAYNVMVGLLA